MKAILITILSLFLLEESGEPIYKTCLNSEEKKLYDLIMTYRESKKLPSIPLSAKLTQVAQAHVKDLIENYKEGETCNFHSWSKKGDWSPCCYTSDHKQAACMWNKPKEIAGYEGNGFEIAYWSSAGGTAIEALDGWKKSSGHNAVIVNSTIWKDMDWKAIGIGLNGEYGVVWFGETEDTTEIIVCQ